MVRLYKALLLLILANRILQPSFVQAAASDPLQEQLTAAAQTVFVKAEALYPEFFSSASEFRTTQGFIYKFYASQQTYIGINAEKVYLLGGTFGNQPVEYGSVSNILQFLVSEERQRLSKLSDPLLAQAFTNKLNDVQIRGRGIVTRLLADDVDGDKHQRFILQLNSKQTLLIAHNIDLAPRVAKLAVGDDVEFYGEYEWSAEGGVLHWTHHDPQVKHVGGWLKHLDKTYE
jgi:hypothetical protein